MSDLVEMAEELEQAERLKRRGMELASVAQELIAPGWADRAYLALLKIARENPTVHIDQFLTAFTEQPSHPNAMGQIWRRALKEHIIVHSGRVKPCSVDARKRAHSYGIYMSLLYRRTN